MTTDDQIQDYIEYLVQNEDVRTLKDLLPNQREKLSLLILINNGAYIELIKLMNSLLKKEVERYDQSNIRYNQARR